MRSGVLAKKIGMSSFFMESGKKVPVTVLHVYHCEVVGSKKIEKDGYNAVVLGIEDVDRNKLSKPLQGFFDKNQISPKRILKEFRVSKDDLLDVGTVIKADYFTKGQFIDVSGISIGKGFAGGMKRWNFRGLEGSHGVSVSHRSIGSTGGRQDPGKVFKNKKMPGHLGVEKVTIQNLKIIDVDHENNLLIVIGAVPGAKNSRLKIIDSVKKL